MVVGCRITTVYLIFPYFNWAYSIKLYLKQTYTINKEKEREREGEREREREREKKKWSNCLRKKKRGEKLR